MTKIILTMYVIATSAALILLKLGTKFGAPIAYADHKLQFNITLYSASGIFLYGTSFLIYTYLISRFELGYIIPLTTALVYILIFFASAIVFKESFTIIKVAGICLIVLGATLLNTK